MEYQSKAKSLYMVQKCQAKRGASDLKISNSLFSEDTGFVIAPYQNIVPHRSD